MAKTFDDLLDYCYQSGLEVTKTNKEDGMIIVAAEQRGISNMMIDCEEKLVLMEQPLYKVTNPSLAHFKKLLMLNRSLVHGAFVLDSSGQWVIFRDTLELENLDYNEFEGSINALGLGLAEFSQELLDLNQKG